MKAGTVQPPREHLRCLLVASPGGVNPGTAGLVYDPRRCPVVALPPTPVLSRYRFRSRSRSKSPEPLGKRFLRSMMVELREANPELFLKVALESDSDCVLGSSRYGR